MPTIRTSPEDFVVEELPLYVPEGRGPFLWLWVEKRLADTEAVARKIARAVGVAPKHVGYAGRKDRIAVARQWFSVPASDRDPQDFDLADARVLHTERHIHRLRVGELRGNRFTLRVRGVEREVADRAETRLDEMARRGMPNRYGPQRFGRRGDNAERGLEILRGERRLGERRHGWLMVSALQSAVFNEVLRRRSHALDDIWTGDVIELHATGEQMWASGTDEERRRAAEFEISATGPIFGTKMKRPQGRAAELEARVLADFELPPIEELEPPAGVRMYGSRRPLRVRPRNTDHRLAGDDLELRFDLPPGAYATILLEELFPDGYDESRGHGAPDDDPVDDGDAEAL
ncbi:MAG: tRNA pseudouridine(13) synthase TruD [Acidobacteriota bacterium]